MSATTALAVAAVAVVIPLGSAHDAWLASLVVLVLLVRRVARRQPGGAAAATATTPPAVLGPATSSAPGPRRSSRRTAH